MDGTSQSICTPVPGADPFVPLTASDLLRAVTTEHRDAAPTLEAGIWLEGLDGRRHVQSISFPVPKSTQTERQICRLVASEANNLAVTRGGYSLHIVCPPELSATNVLKSVDRHYLQLTQMLTSATPVTASRIAPSWDARHPPRQQSHVVSPVKADSLAIGINVGQTDTKVVVTDGAGVVGGLRWRVPTFLPTGRTDQSLLIRLTEIAGIALRAAGQQVHHVGLAIAGIVRAGVVERRSGVALKLDDEQYEGLVALPDLLSKRFGVNVTLVQDVEAKAYYHALSSGMRDCLILDVGTSLGGAYIDAHGSLAPYLNQVGRMAFDLDSSAVPRQDGQGDGLLSQYLSARGAVRLAAGMGVGVADTRELERFSFRSGPHGQHLLNQWLTCVAASVRLCASQYKPSSIMLTGGVTSGRLGALTRTWLNRRLHHDVLLSEEPLFDGAIGAAWAGLSRAT